MQKYAYFQYAEPKMRKNLKISFLLIGDVQNQILGTGTDADLGAPDTQA